MSKRQLAILSVLGNLILVGVVVMLVVALTSGDEATPSGTSGNAQTRAPGARALGANPAQYSPPDQADGIFPEPVAATEDVPGAYSRGCQVGRRDTKPVVCDYGDPDGEIDVALVGDSKALQWISAVDTLGEEHGWQVQTMTKSTCPFTAAARMVHGERFTACERWNDAVLDRLVDRPPDVVVTSQRTREAMDDPADPAEGQSAEAMADGLHDQWGELIDAGSEVIVVRDNPSPPYEGESGVYECVAEHPDDLARCSFSREEGERASAGDAQLAAAKRTPEAHVVDLNDYICPADTCPPVIGDALVYRQSSHLTRTYIESLTDRLEDALLPLIPLR